MTINVEDYLSEEEKKQIAIDVFKEVCRQSSVDDFERIITNSAYNVVWKSMDDIFDNNCIAKLRDKIRHIINDFTAFNIFKKPDAWDRGSNDPYNIMVQCVQEYKPLLSEKVEKAMHQLPNKDMRPLVIEAMKKAMK